MGKTFSRDTDYVRDNWSTRSTECCLCAWLIRDCNNDLMKACDVGDVKMISTCVTCGAWMNYTMPRDPAGNTPLHLAVQQCDEFKEEYIPRGLELGIDIDEESGYFVSLESSLVPRDDEHREEIIKNIAAWQKKHDNDILAMWILCGPGGRCEHVKSDRDNSEAQERTRGFADPLFKNAEGKTAIEMATTKDPVIVDILEQQIERLNHLRKKATEEDAGKGGGNEEE